MEINDQCTQSILSAWGMPACRLPYMLFVEVWWSLLWASLVKKYFFPRGREQNASGKFAGTEASTLDLPIPVTR